MKKIDLQDKIPLDIRNKKNVYILYETLDVAVHAFLYNHKKKILQSYFESTSLPKNSCYGRKSLHAEELALKYLIKEKLIHNKDYNIYIFKFNKQQSLKSKFCCERCSNILKSHYLEKRVFTFDKNKKIIPAIIKNPQKSIAYLIKNQK